MPPLNLYPRVRFLLCSLHTRRGVQCAPGFPCPLCFGGEKMPQSLGRIPPRECGCTSVRCLTTELKLHPRHCEERSDEAIHASASGEMDCFASLAMTTEGAAPTHKPSIRLDRQRFILRPLAHRAVIEREVVVAEPVQQEQIDGGGDTAAAIGDHA